MPEPQPTRIFVICAAASDHAVVFCRGPADWYHVLKWDMVTDRFEAGAWLRGRIYPEKCDVSPDGKLLLCFIHQGRKANTTYSDSWTSVSRSPWLTALALWPNGTTYGGGGRFTGPRDIVLHASAQASLRPHPDHPGVGLHVVAGDPPRHASSDEVKGADWSGRERNGTLIFAREGKLYRRRQGKKPDSAHEDQLVIDLSHQTPDPVRSPAWASRPL